MQSAALFNTAIIRQPNNQRFQDDQHDLRTHVQNRANAKQNLANLMSIAKRVKTQIVETRDNVSAPLKDIIKNSKYHIL